MRKKIQNRYALGLFLYLFLLKPIITFGQNQPEIQLDTIVIQTPKSISADIPKSSSSLKLSPNSSSPISLPESIGQLSGVSLQKYGGLEAATAISIRGSNSQHVQVIWDGIPLDSASGKGINLNHISTSQLAQIQIYKTLSPLSANASNANGTIILNSKPIQRQAHGQWGVGVGSYSTRELFVQSTVGQPKFDLGLGLDALFTQGDFEYLDTQGTPINTSDDKTTTRKNNDLNQWHTFLQTQLKPSRDYEIGVKADYFYIEKGVAGLANFQSQHARFNQHELLNSVKFKTTSPFSDQSNWQNQTYTRFILTKFSDPYGEIGLGTAQKTHDTTFIFGNITNWHQTLSPALTWDHSLQYSYESFLPKNELNTQIQGAQSYRHQWQWGTQPTLSLLNQSLEISGKIKWLYNQYNLNNNNPSLNPQTPFVNKKSEMPLLYGLQAKQKLFAPLTLKSSLSKDVRLPQFNEMFGDQGYVLGNPQLTSEKTLKWDAGFIYQNDDIPAFKTLRLETAYFTEWSKNLIEFEITNGVAKARNIGKTHTQGLENFLYFKPTEWLQNSIGYTFLLAQDQVDHRYLIGRPKHEITWQTVFSINNFSLQNHIEWLTDKYLDALNTQNIQNRARVDVTAQYTINDRHNLTFEMKNLTNSQIEDALGFPLPGRSFFLRFKSQW